MALLDTIKGYTDLGMNTLSSVIGLQKTYEEGRVEVAGKAASVAKMAPSILAGTTGTIVLIAIILYILLKR